MFRPSSVPTVPASPSSCNPPSVERATVSCHVTTLSHIQTAFALQPVEQELNSQGGEQQAHQTRDDLFCQWAHPLGSRCAESQDGVACQTDQRNASQQDASIEP